MERRWVNKGWYVFCIRSDRRILGAILKNNSMNVRIPDLSFPNMS